MRQRTNPETENNTKGPKHRAFGIQSWQPVSRLRKILTQEKSTAGDSLFGQYNLPELVIAGSE